MKKWECTVCGYIHEGEEPPKECPVCGAGAEYFKELVEQEAASKPEAQSEAKPEPVSERVSEVAAAPPPQPAGATAKKWECTVCGYIHEGPEPPDVCPVCGAGKEYFREIVEKETKTLTEAVLQPEAEPEKKAGAGVFRALVMKHHLHPIAVHTPNGVLPLALVFLALSIVLGLGGFETAAFYNLVFVLLAMPFVIATGYIAWQERYKGAKTKIFGVKIGATLIVCVTLLVLVIWRLIDPEVAASPGRWTYLLICLISVGAAGLAGHMGAKLVFGPKEK